MNQLNESLPVFVVGPVRSGSTLLRLMLTSHPQITNPGECDFLFDMVGDHGELPSVPDYIRWLSANRIFQAKRVDVNPALTYIELMQSFLRQLRSKDAVLAMNVHRHFHRIPYIYPEARYIRLLRDPRDVARSSIGMGWTGHVYYGVDIWIDAEKSWQELRKQLSGDQYLEIKYEDLMIDVEGGLSKICDFLGLAYSNQMMNYASGSHYGLPDKKLSYQWKRKYTVRELQLVEGKVGARISELGYELSGYGPAIPGWWEKARLYLQNKKFRIVHQVKRYGIGLYLENFLASRIGSRDWKYSCQQKKSNIDTKYLK